MYVPMFDQKEERIILFLIGGIESSRCEIQGEQECISNSENPTAVNSMLKVRQGRYAVWKPIRLLDSLPIDLL